MTEEPGMVEVQVGYWEGPLGNPGRFIGHRERFKGRLVYQENTGYEVLRLYRCPEGFRVRENDDRIDRQDGSYELYPYNEGPGPERYGYYTAEELVKEWPELARAAGLKPTD